MVGWCGDLNALHDYDYIPELNAYEPKIMSPFRTPDRA